MKPATKFWLVLGILLLTVGTIKEPYLIGALYLMYSVTVIVLYTMIASGASETALAKEREKLWFKASLFIIIYNIIKKFNSFINNKFTK